MNSSAIAAAALAQVGTTQDCTMLVTNALRAVGINSTTKTKKKARIQSSLRERIQLMPCHKKRLLQQSGFRSIHRELLVRFQCK